MNPSGNRKYSKEGDKDIVCAPGNRGSTRSSDPHERRNDPSTVSTRDPAKLKYP